MVLRDSGKQRIMTVLLSRDDAVGAPDLAEYDFEELSDGQRALISLYTVLACAMSKGRLVLFDEPDNYISLAEIQPWLLALTDKVEMGGAQAIIVSHHPELLNHLRRSTASFSVGRMAPPCALKITNRRALAC